MNGKEVNVLTEQFIALTQSNQKMAASVENAVKTLNDNNVLHNKNIEKLAKSIRASSNSVNKKVCDEHKTTREKIQDMTTKYWYLILVAMILLGIIGGAKVVISELLKGGATL